MKDNTIWIDKYYIDDLIDSFNYIEKVRSYGVNKSGKKRRLNKTLNADLYYAGAPIYKLILKHGNRQQRDRIKKIISDYKHLFN